MTPYTQLIVLFVLIFLSAFLSCSEISLAAARRARLQVLAEEGDRRAQLVINLQEHPGQFFSAIQLGNNAVALLGGIVGDAAFSPFFTWCFEQILPPDIVANVGFILSFTLATLLFVIFADLLPKRLAVARPEAAAMALVRPLRFVISILRPLVYVLEHLSDSLMRSIGFPTKRQDTITPEDILASVGAGAAAGVIAPQEEAVIQNVFDLESRLVTSAMTPREDILFFTLDESEENIRAKITSVPYNRFVVVDKNLDHAIGYVDSKHILKQVLEGKHISLKEQGIVQTCPFIPDSLTLSEVLDVFQRAGADFAVIINEYALVVGVITLNDVMSTVMGDLVTTPDELQIIDREDGSWLVDGSTPIDDLEHALDIDEFPEDSSYETVAGFMMYMLRKIPKRTDKVTWQGYTFEVLDVDNNRIDQIFVTKNPNANESSTDTKAPDKVVKTDKD
ncbi:MAG: hemolysin family protein [Sutterella sp.]|nr:hemolysin family protein [Sutterella sp.]